MIFIAGLLGFTAGAIIVYLFVRNIYLYQYIDRASRQMELKDVYRFTQKEYYEQNEATNISVFFEDVLLAIPKESLENNNIESLFESSLKTIKNYKGI